MPPITPPLARTATTAARAASVFVLRQRTFSISAESGSSARSHLAPAEREEARLRRGRRDGDRGLVRLHRHGAPVLRGDGDGLSGLHRLVGRAAEAGDGPVQLRSHFARVGKALAGIVQQRAADDPLHVARHLRVAGDERRDGHGQPRAAAVLVFAGEQARAREHLERHHAQAEDVGRAGDGLAAKVLGRAVELAAEPLAGHGQVRARFLVFLVVQHLGDAEVQHADGWLRPRRPPKRCWLA
jgi:hypothetical protein